MRNYIAINANDFVPAEAGGIISLSPVYKFPSAWLSEAINKVAATGAAGTSVTTFASTFAAGDQVKLTFTSNAQSSTFYRKTFTLDVQTGATSVTAIAAAFAAMITAEIANGASGIYASATSLAGVLTVTQSGDDKRALLGFAGVTSTAGTATVVNTGTTYSEGQPSDLVDKGIAASSITLATYDTVRIKLKADSASPFIDSDGKVIKEIYWFGENPNGADLVTLVNT